MPSHYYRMRVFGRDLIREGHYGQRSCEPHLKAEHTGAPTNAANVKKVLATSEPSTHGDKPDILCSFRAFPLLTPSGHPFLGSPFNVASNRSLAFLKSGMVEYVACAPNLVQFRRPPVLLVQGAACRCDGPHAKATTTQKVSCRLRAQNRHKPRRCICGWASRNRRRARCYDVSAGLNDRH